MNALDHFMPLVERRSGEDQYDRRRDDESPPGTHAEAASRRGPAARLDDGSTVKANDAPAHTLAAVLPLVDEGTGLRYAASALRGPRATTERRIGWAPRG